MLRQVRSNAITVDPFANRKSITPNINQKQRINQLTQKVLVSDKTADTLTSSITTLLHATLPDVKSFGASSSNRGIYLDKYFIPYRRFSEKKNANKSPSPLNENCTPVKVSSDIGSFRNSVQAIDHDQISMTQSGTSNKDQKTKNFCNSQKKLKSLQNDEEKKEYNQIQSIYNKQLIEQIQEQNNFESLQNQDKFIHNNNQESSQLLTSKNQEKSFTSIKSDENEQKSNSSNLIIQKHDSIESIQYYVKQFRIQIKKTILLNQTQHQNPEIIKQQNPEIQEIYEEMTIPKIINQKKQDLVDLNFNQTKSEVLKPQQKFSNSKFLQSGFYIRLLIAILIVILLIKIYTPLV